MARNPEAITSGFISEKETVFPEAPSLRNQDAVMEINLGSVRIKVSNQVNPHLLAETIRLLGGDAVC
jgi:hypothetical protein